MMNPDREELVKLEAERAELIAKNEAATSWGAAVGARYERILEIDRRIAALRRLASSEDGVKGEPVTRRVSVPEGQTPLDDKLEHRYLNVIKEGATARDTGSGSPYHGHSLEHCLHAAGWVQRDLRLALDKARAPADAGMREALELAHGKFCKIAGTEFWTDSCLDGWHKSPAAVRDYAEMAAAEIDAALTAPGATEIGPFPGEDDAGKVGIAPGATTKSDGGGGSRPALKKERIETTTVHEDRTTSLAAVRQMAGVAPGPSDHSSTYTIAHDGFTGTVQGHYVTREGKQGVVLQQVGTRVVHVYGRKWIDGDTTSNPSSTRSDVTVEELAATLCKACGDYWWQSSIHGSDNKRWIERATKLLETHQIRRKP